MDDKVLEFLGLLQEECAEVIQIASKVRRFGMESKNPYVADSPDNRALLEHELGDVILIYNILAEQGAVNKYNVDKRVVWKREKLIDHGILPSSPSFKDSLLAFAETVPQDFWDDLDADRKRDRVLSEISCAADEIPDEFIETTPVEEQSQKRKYLLHQAAMLLKEIERLPKEDDDED